LANKQLYGALVTEFVRSGGRAETIYTHAYSAAQAHKQITRKFNKKYGFIPEKFVEMENPEEIYTSQTALIK